MPDVTTEILWGDLSPLHLEQLLNPDHGYGHGGPAHIGYRHGSGYGVYSIDGSGYGTDIGGYRGGGFGYGRRYGKSDYDGEGTGGEEVLRR